MEPYRVEMLFVLPDISGYTRFMMHNKRTPEHAQKIITELMEVMIREERMPLRISEVEGDALFLYAQKQNELQWVLEKETIAKTIESFSAAFYSKIREITDKNTCECESCGELSKLGLKVIVHYGEAIIDNLDRFTTINGVDVIIAHRLLKNSLSGDYILVTEPAFAACPFPSPERFVAHQETYDDVGTIRARVYTSSQASTGESS